MRPKGVVCAVRDINGPLRIFPELPEEGVVNSDDFMRLAENVRDLSRSSNVKGFSPSPSECITGKQMIIWMQSCHNDPRIQPSS